MKLRNYITAILLGITALASAQDSPRQDTNGAGGIMAVQIRSNITGQPPGNDVYAYYSPTAGDTWNSPVLVNSDAATNGNVWSTDVCYAGNSTWVCAWWSQASSGTNNEAFHISRSTDNGITWAPPSVILSTDNINSILAVSMASDRQGKILLANSGGLMIRSADFGQTWTWVSGPSDPQFGAVNVSYNGQGVWLLTDSHAEPDSPYGTVLTVHRSTDFGNSWQETQIDAQDVGPGSSGSAIASQGQNVVVVSAAFNNETPYPGLTDFVLVSTDGGVHFSDPVSLMETDIKGEFDVAVDSSGHWVIMADKLNENDSKRSLFCFRSSDLQNWSQSTVLQDIAVTSLVMPTALAVGQEHFVTLYNDQNGSLIGIAVAISTDAGANWTLNGFTDSLPSESLYFLSGNRIDAVNTQNPGTLIYSSIGDVILPDNDTLAGIDFDRQTRTILGVGVSGQLYALDISAKDVQSEVHGTKIGAPGQNTPLVGSQFGVDIDPSGNSMRIVSNDETNLEQSLANGSILADQPLSPAGNIVSAAYLSTQDGSTLYGIDSVSHELVTIGGLNGNPSAASGAINSVGPVPLNFTQNADLEAVGNSLYAILSAGGTTNLYRLEPATGAVIYSFGAIAGNPSVRSATMSIPDPPPQQPNGILAPKLNVKINWSKVGKDSIKLQGLLAVPPDFNTCGLSTSIKIGDLERTFVLDVKGKAKSFDGSFKAKVHSNKKNPEDTNVAFKIILKGDLKAGLEPYGVTNIDADNEVIELPVRIDIGSVTGFENLAVLYKSKAGKSGKIKS